MQRPVSELSADIAKRLTALLTDIDDTLTYQGKLVREAYDALWRLGEAGIAVVAVTGRPAGWCDMVARQWPVAGVIGENGALAFYERDGVLERLFHPEAHAQARARLVAVERDILAEVAGARVAQDQAYRMFDLAIDFREEPPDLGLAAAERIKAVFERHGAKARVSSIHVNGWFGDYDKLAMARLFWRQRFGTELDRERAIFVGDSPNDEPMFAYFPHACGVQNVAQFAGRMQAEPAYIAQAAYGLGFAEVAETLLRLRAL